MLKHQIILHPDIANQFPGELPPYEWQAGFSWYLCPVTISGKSEWLLVNVEFGYCQLVTADGPITDGSIASSMIDISDAAISAIEAHLPDDEDNVSVSLSGVTLHTADKIPEHVASRYMQAVKAVSKCNYDAEDVIDKLNDTPITIGGRTFAPTEGLEGLLLELSDKFKHYMENTPWWKVRWHMWKDRTPWLEMEYRRVPK